MEVAGSTDRACYEHCEEPALSDVGGAILSAERAAVSRGALAGTNAGRGAVASPAATGEARSGGDTVRLHLTVGGGGRHATALGLASVYESASAGVFGEAGETLKRFASEALSFLVEVERIENIEELWEALDGRRDDDRWEEDWSGVAVSLALRESVQADPASALEAFGVLGDGARELLRG